MSSSSKMAAPSSASSSYSSLPRTTPVSRDYIVPVTPSSPSIGAGAGAATTHPHLHHVKGGENGGSATSSLLYDSFIDGLGPGQVVSRQMLACSSLGDVQVSLVDRSASILAEVRSIDGDPAIQERFRLEVEVIRARGLVAKQGAKNLPAPYIKLYMLDGKKCVAKAKTTIARRTLDPLYQQQLIFNEDYHGKVLQITVWGDYSRLERKVFMGVCQIQLDQLDLSNILIGWYKLFGNTSLGTNSPAISLNAPPLLRQNSMSGTSSFDDPPPATPPKK